MDENYAEPRPLDIDGLIDPGAFGERMIFDPVPPGGAISACGKCGKSIGNELTNLEDDFNELKRHIYRNPEILKDIMNRWNIVPGQLPETDRGPNP